MEKIPTLFVRDPDDRRRVLNEVTPGCEWVLAGVGVATRKYDGTCVMFDGERWWVRREVKADKDAPRDWVEVAQDEATGKRVGWESAEASGFVKFLTEAIDAGDPLGFPPGTYELCGPKINGNPEGFAAHRLVEHADAEVFLDVPLDYEHLRHFLLSFTSYEGIVWHHPDGRMAKLKRRDFEEAKRAGQRSSVRAVEESVGRPDRSGRAPGSGRDGRPARPDEPTAALTDNPRAGDDRG